MSDTMIEQSTIIISEIVNKLERLEEDFLNLNIEEVLTKKPELSAATLLNLSNIEQYLSTVPIIFLSACELALKEKNDS